MLISTFLFIGAVAFLVSGIAVLTSNNGIAIWAGVIGFVLWGIFAFGALNMERATRCCIQRFSNPALSMVGVMLALVPGYIALTGPVEIVNRARNPNSKNL